MENKYHITLVGSGMIGAGLAVNALMNGHPTIIYDVIDLEKVKKTVQDVLDIMVEAGAITGEKAAEAASLASYTNDLDGAVEKADFVQECVPERIELKQSIYRQIQEKRETRWLYAVQHLQLCRPYFRRICCIRKRFW